ncbi:MAG TPA: aminotransferase class I/II-fold pyridoxal phosphate-dependent enzyme [Kineosporiaceae bacterium]|nr:aminotransferase class I/II-fold pyridoxal phosphate-dependent enzyme [Kineosporiaceae bacterium]
MTPAADGSSDHDEPTLAAATLAVTSGRPRPEPNQPMSVPVVMSSTFVSSDAGPRPTDFGYGRWGNPTWTALEEAVGVLEGGRALSFSAGMAAVSAVLSLVPVGATVVIPVGAYSGTTELARQLAANGQLKVREVQVSDTEAVTESLTDAALLLIESPTNPLLEIADLPAVAAAARAAGALLVVDNTFATPLLQRPLELGAHISIHSATKYLGGHSDALLGVAVTNEEQLAQRLHRHRSLTGSIPGTWEAWLVLRGMRTLALRVERAGANALELARRLVDHPAVERVRHPSLPTHPGRERALEQMTGFGAIISIEVVGGAEAAERVCSATRLWVHTSSLGGVESTLERRRRYPSESPAVPESLLRLSVGIEDVDDLWRDLDAALRACEPPLS